MSVLPPMKEMIMKNKSVDTFTAEVVTSHQHSVCDVTRGTPLVSVHLAGIIVLFMLNTAFLFYGSILKSLLKSIAASPHDLPVSHESSL